MKNEKICTILNDNPCDMFDDMEKSGTFEELKKINEWDFDLTDEKKWELVDDEIYYNYDSERKNLSCVLDGKIMVIADLGLWNGRRSGYKYLTENLNSIFDVGEDYNEWYIDDLGDIRCKRECFVNPKSVYIVPYVVNNVEYGALYSVFDDFYTYVLPCRVPENTKDEIKTNTETYLAEKAEKARKRKNQTV